MSQNNKPFSFLGNISDSISEGVDRRFSDPVISTFSITFLIFNYEIIFYALSSLDVEQKIENITKILHTPIPYLGPSLITAIILFGLPRCKKMYDLIEDGRIFLKNSKIQAERNLIPFQIELKREQELLKAEVQRNNALNQEVGKLSEQLKNVEAKKEKVTLELQQLRASLQKQNRPTSAQSSNWRSPRL